VTAAISAAEDEGEPVAGEPGEHRTGGRSVVRHPALVAFPVVVGGLLAGLVVASRDGPGLDHVVPGAVVSAWVMAGAVLVCRRPLCRLGAVVLLGALVGAITLIASTAERAVWGGVRGELAEAVFLVGSFVIPAVALHGLLSLPRGELTRTRRGWVLVGYGTATAAGLALWASGAARPGVATWAAWALALLAGVPGARASYSRTAGLERQRLQWVGCGLAIATEVAIVVAALDVLVHWPARPGVVAGAGTLVVPLAVALSASPRMAARADRVLVHTVSVAGLTATTVAVYVVIVVGLGGVTDDSDRRLLGLSMAAAAVAAALYLPTRARLGDAANRLVYGERHAPDEVLRTFGARLSRAVPMDELLLQLAESLRKTLALTRAEVWTGTQELLERSVSVPYADVVKVAIGHAERPVLARAGVSGPAWLSVWLPSLLEGREAAQVRAAPVTHSGALLGLIVVERPGDGDAFGEEDDRVLTELARQVGLALHNVQLDSALLAALDDLRRTNGELRASRARIVASGDAERRKIERNLHDGAQQHLVALAVNLRLTRDILAEDPAAAAEMLEQLGADVKETIALAHGIYPPLLIDAGLPEALRAAAGRSPLSVEVRAEGVGRHDADTEAAVYFCCLEALQNAAKHAPDAEVCVRLWEADGSLQLEVADDGPGFEPGAATRGNGFTNMSDRLGAIGGSVRWESASGSGTQIRASVPARK
jgi:signal transduction histidine kinase